MLAGYGEILKEKKPFCGQTLVFDSFKAPSGTRPSPLVLFDIADDDPEDLPTVQLGVPSRWKCHLFSRSQISCQFVLSLYLSLLKVKTRQFGTTLPIRTWRLWENMSRLTSSRITSLVSEPSAT